LPPQADGEKNYDRPHVTRAATGRSDGRAGLKIKALRAGNGPFGQLETHN
jgi:hypothetical protein